MLRMRRDLGPPTVRWYIVAAICIIIIIGIGAGGILFSSSQSYELILGLIIIFGSGVLTVLLFIMASAFSALKLTDTRQALGLPSGSVRAMIALLLIIIWAIVSIFVFRFVAFGNVGPNGPAGAASADGIKLAQQLFTTMSTLVVAVSAFYFGSSAAARKDLIPAQTQPTILKVVPNIGKQGQGELPLTIVGKNFLQLPKSIRLILDTEVIIANGIVLNNTEVSLIDCNITINDNQTVGQWDLIITNDDGCEFRLPKAFTVMAKTP